MGLMMVMARSARWGEDLEGKVVGVFEGQSRAVGGVDDVAVRDAELVESGLPGVEGGAVGAGERKVIEAGPALVERLGVIAVGELV